MIKVYDFDKTLTYQDTSRLFLYFCSNSPMKKLSLFFLAILSKVNLLSNLQYKKISCNLVFKRMTKFDIEKLSIMFFESNPLILNSLGKSIKFNELVSQYIVTASPTCYVSKYFNDVPVIGTTFNFDSNGFFDGIKFNCFGSNKVLALRERGITEIDEFFTDSFSDTPLMKISNVTYLVNRNQVRKL